MDIVTAERAPLQRPTGSLLPWKTDTKLRKNLFDLSEVVEVLLQIERALKTDDPGISWGHTWMKYIDIQPKDDAHARRIVGKLMRAFKAKPKIEKTSDETMESYWFVSGVKVTVKGYLQKTCHYEEIEVDVPAQEARTETIKHAAVPAHKATRRVIVCDDAKPEPQAAEEVAAAAVSEEVPF